MVQIGSVVLNVTDIGRAAAFWRDALGYVRRADGHEGVLVPRGGEGPALLLDETDTTHLDLHVGSEQEQRAEVERLIALGARRVDWVYPEVAGFVVLADTGGCLGCLAPVEGARRRISMMTGPPELVCGRCRCGPPRWRVFPGPRPPR